MSFLHKTEPWFPHAEADTTLEENVEIENNDKILSQFSCVKEEIVDINKNLKSENECLLKEEIENFINNQFDPKYDKYVNDFNYKLSINGKSKDLKTLEEESVSENKNGDEAELGIYNNSDLYNGKEIDEIVYSDWKQDIVEEEIKFEEDSSLIPSSGLFFSTDSRLLLHDEEFENECKFQKSSSKEESSTVHQNRPYSNWNFKARKNIKLELHSSSSCEEAFLSKDLNQHTCSPKYATEYSCLECSDSFKCSREFKSDYNLFQDSDKLRCYHCSLTFVGKRALNSHMRSHKEVFRRRYECNVCKRVFNFQSNLTRHLMIHSGYKPYTCKLCAKSFSRLEHLKLHNRIRKHTDLAKETGQISNESNAQENPDSQKFVCEICGLAFRIKQRLQDHLKRHIENKLHICEVCNRAFKQVYNLKQHLLSHNGTRDFICDVCEKGFWRKAFLKQHMLVHTKEKKYVCEICDKRYYKSCHVTAHKKKVHARL